MNVHFSPKVIDRRHRTATPMRPILDTTAVIHTIVPFSKMSRVISICDVRFDLWIVRARERFENSEMKHVPLLSIEKVVVVMEFPSRRF